MGILKARVSGAWVPINGVGAGPPGGPVPVGGVAGDLIIKNSATDFDVRWGTSMPTLTLTGDASQYGRALIIPESTHATSERAAIQFGAGGGAWELGMSASGDATKNFYIYNGINGRTSLQIDPTARIFGFSDGTGQVDLNLDGAQVANGPTTPRVSSNGSWVNVHAKTDTYIDGNTIYFRNASYGAVANFGTDGSFNVNNWLTVANGTSRFDVSGVEARWWISGGVTTITMLADKFNLLNKAANAWILQFNGAQWWTPYQVQIDGTLVMNGYVQGNGRVAGKWDQYDGGNKGWDHAGLRAEYTVDRGNNTLASVALHPGSVAPQVSVFRNAGEVISCANAGRTGHCASWASAFIVNSRRDMKDHIEPVVATSLLDRIKGVALHTFRYKIPPQRLRPSGGRLVPFDHNCAIDDCPGTDSELDPCGEMMNHNGRYGFMADEIVDVFPEVAHRYADKTIQGVDISQVAMIALAGVQALLARVEALEATP